MCKSCDDARARLYPEFAGLFKPVFLEPVSPEPDVEEESEPEPKKTRGKRSE